MNRRQLFQRSLGLAGSLVLGDFFPRLSLFAASGASPRGAPDHFLVCLRTAGAAGMDVTLGLDPWILPASADAGDMFIEYRPEEIVQGAGIRLGPAAKALAPFASDCLVINGVMMRQDAGHDVCMQYMLSGRGDGKAAVLPVEMALGIGTGPFGLVINAPIYLAGKSIDLSTTSDILQSAGDGGLIDLIEERIKMETDEQGTPLEEAEAKLVEGKTAATKLQEWLEKFKHDEPPLEDRHVIAAAFASGAAVEAQCEITYTGTLDTHSNHEKAHLQAQTTVWEQVAKLFRLFKQVPCGRGSLFDRTTFLVMSEFSRTPALNPARGKDHNPYTNSCLLAGCGIQGGKVIGASRLIPRKQTGTGMSTHIAWPYDYKAQQLATHAEGASFIYPENIIRTIGLAYGNPPAFAPVPMTVPAISGIVKN